MPKHIAIIGAGIVGITLAFRLSSQGFKVTLIEADEEIGGLLRSQRIGGYSWDRFYHVLLKSDSEILTLVDELGLRSSVEWREAKNAFFVNGCAHSMSSAIELLRFPKLSLMDKIRLGVTILYASRINSWKHLEHMPVDKWLQRLSGKRTFNTIWMPMLRSKLGDNYRVTNASFMWSAISRMYRTRKIGQNREQLGYVGGGYTKIIDRLKRVFESRGVDIYTYTKIKSVKEEKKAVYLRTQNNGSLVFDWVVITIPCPEIVDMCPQLSTSEKERLGSVKYQGVVCVALIYEKPLLSFYLTGISDDWIPFTGIIEMTALVDRKYFDGHSLVYLPRYMGQQDLFWEKTDDELINEFLGALERMNFEVSTNRITAYNVSRARMVQPISTINYSKELLPPTETTLKHICVVNSAQIPTGAMNVNELVGLANRKAEELGSLLADHKPLTAQ